MNFFQIPNSLSMTTYESDVQLIRHNPLKVEKISWKYLSLDSLPSEIFKCKNLKSLTLHKCSLKVVQKDIQQLKKLEYLDLNSNPIDKLPVELLDLKKLKTLNLMSCAFTKFPSFLFQHESLEDLYLKNNLLTEIPSFTASQTILKTLDVCNNKVVSISSDLEKLTNLEYLNISWNKITDLPIKQGRLSKLKQLEFQNNPLSDIPKCIKGLKEITLIDFSSTNIKTLPEWVGNFPELNIIRFGNGTYQISFSSFPLQLATYFKSSYFFGLRYLYPSLSINDEKRLLKQLKELNLPEYEILRYLHLFVGDEQMYQYSSTEIVSEMQKSKEVSIAQNSILALSKSTPKKYPLQKGSEVFLLGKLDIPELRILKKRIKNAGIKLSKKASATTTHIFVSRKIIANLQKGQAHLPFINGEQLVNFLDETVPQYLQEDQGNLEQNVENLRRLLFSKDEHSQLLAFELLKSGGMPKKMLTDLYYLYQTTDNSKVRTKARNVTKKYASPQLVKSMSSRMTIKNSHYSKFKTFRSQVVQGTELDETKLLLYIIRDFGEEIPAINELLSMPQIDSLEILRYATANGKLHLREMLQSQLIPHLGQMPHLRELGLKYMEFTEIPEEIFNLTSLKSLSFSSVTVPEISSDIHNLVNLEKLKLSLKKVQQIPNLADLHIKDLQLIFTSNLDISAVIEGMKNLKKLLISARNITKIPNTLFEFTSLEYLKLKCSGIKSLPTDFEKLENLQHLELDCIDLEKFPDVLTKMPNLTTIQVNGAPRTVELLRSRRSLFPSAVQILRAPSYPIF